MPKKILALFGNVALYGQERANIKVFDTLQKQGADIQLLVNDRGFHWHVQPEVDGHHLQYKKIRFPWNFRKTFSLKIWWIYFRDIILYNIHFVKAYHDFKPDYLHFGNDFFFMMLFPSLLFIRCPIVFRLGDEPTTRYFFEKWLWKSFIIKKVSHFVCISNFIAEKIKSIQPDIKKFSIIYNVPPIRYFQSKNEITLKKEDYFTLAYVGQIEKIKGVHLILEAAKQLIPITPDLRFIFAGETGHSQLFKEIKEDSFYLKNRQQIVFLGKIHDIDAIYNISDIHIAPSVFNEPLSNVIGEAKKNSRPSIVFNSGGLAELVTHKEDGYICTGKTVDDIIEGINYFYQDKEMTDKMGKNAFLSLEKKNLTEKHFKQQWCQVYQML
jgi:glycosyltransferase involved in cell wall biosynthesis